MPSSSSRRSPRAALVALLVAFTLPGAPSPGHADPIAPEPPCKPTPAGAKVTLHLPSPVSLHAMAKWIQPILCKRIVFSSQLGDEQLPITIEGAQTMTAKEARVLFETSAKLVGLVVQTKGSLVTVAPDPKAPCPSAALTAPKLASVPASTLEMRKELGVTAVTDTRFSVKRATFAKYLDDPTKLAKGARVVPNYRDGKPEGIKLFAIRSGSIYAALGFANGDTVLTWDGTVLTTELVLEKYKTLGTAKRVELGVERRGQSLTLVYDLVE